MAWILGFGIPISYIVLGLLSSRVIYRSRYKRDLTRGYDIDTGPICFLVGTFWPVALPGYVVAVGFKGDEKTLFHRFFKWFYKGNLPESNKAKELRRKQESWDYRKRIHDLELECGLKPTEKYLPSRPEEEYSYHYGRY